MPQPLFLDGPDARILLVCDHASNAVPDGIDLGVPPAAMRDHVAWDIGAAAVTRHVAAALGCRAWLAQVSRLVVDCNRAPHDSIPELSDGIAVPGNMGLWAGERAGRLALHAAFHDGFAALIAAARPELLVSVHSFTPALAVAPAPRPWPIAILWNRDERGGALGLAHLGREPGLGGPVGVNEPYSGRELNYTMDRHGEDAGIAYLGFEIRQDLISDDDGAARWAAVVARTTRATLEGL